MHAKRLRGCGGDTELRRPQTVAELEHVTAGLEGLGAQVSPRALLGAVVGHLNTVAALLQGSLGLTARRQLSTIAGETAGLARWLAYDP